MWCINLHACLTATLMLLVQQYLTVRDYSVMYQPQCPSERSLTLYDALSDTTQVVAL